MLYWAAAGLGLRALTVLGALPLACVLAAVCCGCLPGAVLLGLCWLVWRFKTPAECLPTLENIARVEALNRTGLYIRYQ